MLEIAVKNPFRQSSILIDGKISSIVSIFIMVNLVIGSSRSRGDRYRIGDRKGAIAGVYSVALSARRSLIKSSLWMQSSQSEKAHLISVL